MDVMIDIETLGLGSDAPVVQIAAVVFEPVSGGKVLSAEGQVFNCLVNPQDAMDLGAKPDIGTIAWWMRQSPKAKAIMDWDINHPSHPNTLKGPTEQALLWLIEWLPSIGIDWKHVNVWSNGTVLDIGVLQRHFERFGIQQPWVYNSVRDMRTVLALAGGWPEINETGFEKHNALDDCLMQIMALQIILGKLRGKAMLH